MDAIERSIRRFGFTLPIVVDEGTGRLVAGHGRSEALTKMKDNGDPAPRNVEVGRGGEWMVPVIRGNRFASESEAEAYLVADNRLVEIGGWDYKSLIDILGDLDPSQLEILSISNEEFDRFVDLADMADQISPTKTEIVGTETKSNRIMLVAELTEEQHEVVSAAVAKSKRGGSSNLSQALVSICREYMR